MEINLIVPALTSDSPEFVQTNPGILAEDLSSLSRDDFLYTGHRILGDLEQFNQTPVDDELRLKLLDVYRVNIINLAKGMRKLLGESTLPVNKKTLTMFNITMDLHRQLAGGYKRIILNHNQANSTDPADKVLITACERAAFSILETITLAHLSYTPVPENSWKELHTIFMISKKRGFNKAAVHDEIDSSKSLRINDIYLFALLMGLSEPYGLPNGSLYTLLPYFHLWIDYLSLFDKTSLEGLKYYFRIDPELDKPFLPFPEATPSGELYITTDLLTHQILGPKPPFGNAPVDVKRINEIRRKILPKLIKSWTNYPIRKYARNQMLGEIKLAMGLPAVIKLTKHLNSSTADDHDANMQTWIVINDSATGLGIEYSGHTSENINVGDIVISHPEETKKGSGWVTGIIRHFNHINRTHLSLGIQRLPPNPQTGILTQDPVPGEQTDMTPKKMLMYPEYKAFNALATIVTSSGTFTPGATYTVDLENGRRFQIRAIKARESNPRIEQFTFEYLDD